MSLNELLLPEFDQEMANTRRLLELLPEEKFDYKPHPKSMTLGRLAGHVAEMPNWALHALDREVLELPPDARPYETVSRSQLVADFDKFVSEARAKLASASDADLQKPWTLKFGDQTIFTLPRFNVLRSVVMNHMIHHRGQLTVYLRETGVIFPGMYGPSADEAKFWQAEPQTV